jgi:hypothetical protein
VHPLEKVLLSQGSAIERKLSMKSLSMLNVFSATILAELGKDEHDLERPAPAGAADGCQRDHWLHHHPVGYLANMKKGETNDEHP